MNLRWTPPADEVRQADAEPWDGPAAFVLRPMPYAVIVRAASAAVVMYGLAGGASLTLLGTFPSSTLRVGALVLLAVAAVAIAIAVLTVIVTSPPRIMRRYTPLLALTTLTGAGILITVGLLALGPGHGVFATLYVEAAIFAFYMFRRRYAVLSVSLIATEYAVVVAAQNDLHGGIARWVALVTTVAATGMLVGGIAARAEELSASEHAARTELALVNDTLEQRVSVQVEELDRLGRMRRFVSPQVADVLLSAGSDETLQPHRRRIATVFCDLRGFTAFTTGAEPEEVVAVLDEYYRAAGEVLRHHHATIGGFAGDGIMAYFGDPVPSEAPAVDAVRMARDLMPVLDALVESWSHRGYPLGYGVGIAHGYATLGVVGFDGRYDYTPLGSVVNLAARLCSQAQPGQVLLDQQAHLATADQYLSREIGRVELKGFGTDTRVYALERITLQSVPSPEARADPVAG